MYNVPFQISVNDVKYIKICLNNVETATIEGAACLYRYLPLLMLLFS